MLADRLLSLWEEPLRGVDLLFDGHVVQLSSDVIAPRFHIPRSLDQHERRHVAMLYAVDIFVNIRLLTARVIGLLKQRSGRSSWIYTYFQHIGHRYLNVNAVVNAHAQCLLVCPTDMPLL